MRLRNKLIIVTSIFGAATLSLTILLTYSKISDAQQNFITLDAEDGEIELYDKNKIVVPFQKGMTWQEFYKENKYIGANKDGYDFLYWSLDGKEPIANGYVLNSSITIKPVYVVNRDCVTITCRYLNEKNYTDTYLTLRGPANAPILYSYNGGSFKPYNQNQKVYFFDQSTYVSFKTTDVVSGLGFSTTTLDRYNARIAVSGDISVLCAHKDMPNGAFASLFSGARGLVSASGLKLPATTLTESCYESMFQECESLVIGPKELPATTLAASCYKEMFDGCTSLIIAPHLYATTLANQCCYSMFMSCSSLTKAPALPATTLAKGCYLGMFQLCTSLVEPPEQLPATTLVDDCYYIMFDRCLSLTSAPVLSATKLAYRCYGNMFAACISLKSIKIGYTGNFANDQNYFDSWVGGVYPTGDFYYNGSDTARGYSAIPNGWEVHKF